MGLSRLLKPRFPDETELTLAEGPVRVAVRVNARAKSYRLALSARGAPVLTVPAAGRWPEAQAFLMRHRGWLAARLEKRDAVPGFAAGEIIPLRGVPHRIVSVSSLRGVVRVVEGPDGPELHVPGGADHLKRRLTDWLRQQAQADLAARCAVHAQTLGVEIAAIRLRDQTTRWGSCSSARTLNFNWRLVLAPAFVLDYVAAHEVAHILEMNHAPAFWNTVRRALPDYETGRGWLKLHGQGLMAMG